MRPGRAYGTFTLKDGRDVLLRSLSRRDLPEAVRFVNTLVKERSINRELGILLDRRTTRSEENRWLMKRVREIATGAAISVAAFHKGELVGNCEILRQPFKDLRRCGTLGIAVVHGYRGAGLGRLMMRVLLKQAELQGIELVELRVLSINSRALRLYRSLGFNKAGVVPRKIHRRGRYIDEILMFRERGENR